MQTLTAFERESFLQSTPHWHLLPERDAITRTLKFDGFTSAWAFMTRVAAIAERLDHHPEWSNTYDKVVIVLTSHDAGGLTKRDTTMATAIDAVVAG